VGCPIRISTDQCLLAAPRGFSQRATSFIASWCQGIHRMPLSRSRSSDPIPKKRTGPTHHAQEPSPPEGAALDAMADFELSTHNAPERIKTGLLAAAEPLTGQTCNPARPETHQNLIHHEKEQTALRRSAQRGNRLTSLRRGKNPFPRHRRSLGGAVVETIGIEPTTPCLQSRCSPS
jgi:hypothetical protein